MLSFKSNETAQEIFALKEEINSLKVVYNLKYFVIYAESHNPKVGLKRFVN